MAANTVNNFKKNNNNLTTTITQQLDYIIIDHTACSASFSNFYKYTPQFQGLITEHISQSFIYSIMVNMIIPISKFNCDSLNRANVVLYT